MTFREINSAVRYVFRQKTEEVKTAQKNAAFSAYFGAYFSRARSFPKTLEEAFPTLFEDSAPAWLKSKTAFERVAERHNSRKRGERSD